MAQAILRALARKPSEEPHREPRPPVKEPRVLRVGLIEDGRIVDERVIARAASVSVGPSERNTFVVASAELPARFELLERVGEGYRLNFTEAMAGRVARRGKAEELEEIRRSGTAKRRGALYSIDLDEAARGKVVLGEVTLLFQLVMPPPVQPRPQLPASVRGPWTREVDWVFSCVLLGSCALQLGLVLSLVNHDWPAHHDFALLPDSIRQSLLATPPSQVEIEQRLRQLDPAAVEAEVRVEEPAQDHSAGPAPSHPRPAAHGPRAPSPAASERDLTTDERRARIREAMTKAAEAHIVTALRGGPGSAFADTLRGGQVETDQDAIMEQVRSVRVASARDGLVLRSPRLAGDGRSEVADIESLRRTETRSVESDVMGPEHVLPGKVAPEPPIPGPEPGDLPGDVVRRVVRQGLGGIKACYERALPRNPTLAGRITVDFVVGGGGRVVSVRTAENTMGAPEVSGCIERRFRAMRFPEPRGGNASFRYPFLFRPGQ